MFENQFQFLNQMEFYYEIILIMINQFYPMNFVDRFGVQLIHSIEFDYMNI